MYDSTQRNQLLAAALIGALSLGACSDDKSEHGQSEYTAGGEADNAIDRAHQDFKHDVKPAADVVDEKTRAVIKEGKKAVKKTGEALEDVGDDSDESAGESPPAPAQTK